MRKLGKSKLLYIINTLNSTQCAVRSDVSAQPSKQLIALQVETKPCNTNSKYLYDKVNSGTLVPESEVKSAVSIYLQLCIPKHLLQTLLLCQDQLCCQQGISLWPKCLLWLPCAGESTDEGEKKLLWLLLH